MYNKRPQNSKRFSYLIGILPLLLLLLTLVSCESNLQNDEDLIDEVSSQDSIETQLFYGFDLAEYNVHSGFIQKNQFFSQLMHEYNVDNGVIHQLSKNVSPIFDLRKLQSGKEYHILSKNGCDDVSYLIYVPDALKYVVYSFEDDPCAEIVQREVETRIRKIEGEINSSLWVSMEEGGAHYSLISKMENAYAWTVDFFHLQKGDNYKLWYEEEYVDDKIVGTGKLIAGFMNHRGKDLYAIYYDKTDSPGYYNLEGLPMQKAFLKAPVKYYRISSRYNKNRMHPVLKHRRPHLGTDYAASHGTPIMAVASGTITHASFTRGNGNYVKIRHDKVYETQYLHMSKFASGIKPGVHVEQGEIIGYVGSTGLATGPHVCFRFWKNGEQVDPLRLELPAPAPMDSTLIEEYLVYKDKVMRIVNEDRNPEELAELLQEKNMSS